MRDFFPWTEGTAFGLDRKNINNWFPSTLGVLRFVVDKEVLLDSSKSYYK